MLLYYFSELKNRIILLILCWLSSFCTCYSYKEILLFLFIKPSLNLTSKFNKIYFISTNITEIFNTYINLAIFISNQIVFVLLIIHFIFFIIPGLYKYEINILKKIVLIYLIFLINSIFLFYFILLPISWNFFFHFQKILSNNQLNLYFEAKLSEYLDFFMNLNQISTLICQLFTLIFIYITSIKNYLTFIKKSKKIIFFLLFILATVITPPDIFSQMILGSFIIIVYEILILSILFININKVTR
jgi:sec-independent protein translocase protein TatC